MSNRYCIASGTFTDPAIWAATDGGSGGASVPSATDDVYFNQSVSVTNWPNGSLDNRNVFVGHHAVVDVVCATNRFLYLFSGKRLVVDGSLTYSSVVGSCLLMAEANSAVDVGENGRLDTGVNSLYMRTTNVVSPPGTLTNKGEIVGTTVIRPGAATQNTHHIGRVENVHLYVYAPYAGEPLHTLRLSGRLDADELRVYAENSPTLSSLAVDFGATSVRLGALVFQWDQPATAEVVTITQNGPLELTGDLQRTGTSSPMFVDWQLGDHASLLFVGTSDQVITLPPTVTEQPWTVDKPAGNLDLTEFNGFLQGRVRQLTVRAASSIDLAGPPPVLLTTTGAWNCYYGLKADSVSPEGPTTVADHLQEAMDLCENYGLITIPGGKTLCSKSFKNYTGAKVSGTGTLCVRYGGLTNTGTIDPGVDVRFFDRPVLAVLSAPVTVSANTQFFVDLTGSVGDWFRIDWDDESFSEMQSPGVLTHGYVESSGIVLRTLCLTVGTDEGKTDTVTKTITVFPNPHEPVGPFIAGPVELNLKKTLHGVPRGNMPAHYRYTLALGKRFMHDTLQLFCPMSESGRALASGSGLYLGRITHSDGRLPDPLEIVSASYTVYRLDRSDGTVRTPMEGHTAIPLDVGESLLPELVIDENWAFDDIGYNFRHTPDDATFSPFPIAGRDYLVVYTMRLLDQPPKIVFQYRVHVI